MAVLIKGGAGYIGSHIVRELSFQAGGFVVIDNLSTGVRSAISATVASVSGDGADKKPVNAIVREKQIDEIIHFAGSTVVLEPVRKPVALATSAKVGRRAGDSAIVLADSARIRRTLRRHPQFDDLDEIVRHAMAWERQLIAREYEGPKTSADRGVTAVASRANGPGKALKVALAASRPERAAA